MRALPHPSRRVGDRLEGQDHLPTLGGANIERLIGAFAPGDALAFGWTTLDQEGDEVMWMLDKGNGHHHPGPRPCG